MNTLSVDFFKNYKYNALYDYQNITYNILDFFINVQIKHKLT